MPNIKMIAVSNGKSSTGSEANLWCALTTDNKIFVINVASGVPTWRELPELPGSELFRDQDYKVGY